MPHQKTIERKALIVGIVINILQVLAGMAVFFMTGLKAMFLDFSFTAISVLSGLVAAYLSSRTVRTTALPQWHVRSGTDIRHLQGDADDVAAALLSRRCDARRL